MVLGAGGKLEGLGEIRTSLVQAVLMAHTESRHVRQRLLTQVRSGSLFWKMLSILL